MPINKSITRPRQQGSTLVETTLGLLGVLFIAGLCLEVAQIHQVRHLLSLALQEAARIAAVTGANPAHWRPVLTQGVRLTYTSRQSQIIHAQLTKRYGMEPYHAEIIPNPRQENTTGAVLHLGLTYFYAPKQPWLTAIIKAMRHLDTQQKRPPLSRLTQARAAGFIPIVVEYKVLMQSALAD